MRPGSLRNDTEIPTCTTGGKEGTERVMKERTKKSRPVRPEHLKRSVEVENPEGTIKTVDGRYRKVVGRPF